MKIRTVLILFLLILFGGIGLSQWAGWWESESDKIPVLTDTGEYDPGDIRGSYTFGDVEAVFGIPSAVLTEVFGIETPDPAAFPIKELEEIYADLPMVFPEYTDVEIGTGSVRFFVKLYTGIESDLAIPEYMPLAGLSYLLDAGLITEEVYTQYLPLAVDLEGYAMAYDSEGAEEAVEEEEHVESLVKGKTTVQEVLNAGIGIDELEDIMGMTLENRGALIKDLCIENDLEFSLVKEQIDALLQGE